MRRSQFAFVSLLAMLICVGKSQLNGENTDPPSETEATATLPHYPRRLATEHLPNVVQVHERVISGGLPVGKEAFQELQSLGIKTIISVDGMTPDAKTARKFGLRYVHLPHGYDRISSRRVRELAKGVSELPGPIYIHCHHGKHRSPAAAAVACVSARLIPRSQSLSILQLAGTSPHYVGLFEATSKASPIAPQVLKDFGVRFEEKVAVPPLAEAMVEIEQTHERIQLIASAGWRAPANHPDLDPANEALLLGEQFTELLRSHDHAGQGDKFHHYLLESKTLAQQLEKELRKRATHAELGTATGNIDRLATSISTTCKLCHRQYRDNPNRTPQIATPPDTE